MSYSEGSLQDYSSSELKALWEQTIGRSASAFAGRGFLIQNLAYQAQEKAYGGLSKRSQRRLQRLYLAFKESPNYRPPAARAPLKPGVRLVREWQGNVHSVTVLESSFEYLGKEYKSLSAIARLVTGTRWSGPVFFGMKKRGN